MTLAEAQARLKELRTLQKKIRVEISEVRATISECGINPDDRFSAVRNRNTEIYTLFLNGIPTREISKRYNLSFTRVTQICKNFRNPQNNENVKKLS